MSDPAEVAEAQWSGLTGELAFDVGAHLGENIPHLRKAGFKRIVGFEPEPRLFAKLGQIWPEPDVQFLCTAVAGRDGTLEMRYANGMLGNITGDERRTSGCVTLDSMARLLGMPDAVVVDVEGFEAQAMAGGKDVLDSGAAWLVEFHSAALQAWVCQALERYGYAPEIIRHPHYPAGSDLWRGHGWVKALRPCPGRPLLPDGRGVLSAAVSRGRGRRT